MMPPISIDGTDITGATIDGTDVTEITVDGQTVFSAAPTLPVAYSNLVAWYPFDSAEYGGSNADDVTAILGGSGDDTEYDGTVDGSTYQSSSGVTDINAGANSGAFDFDGSNDYIEVSSLSQNNSVFQNSHTITAWIFNKSIVSTSDYMGNTPWGMRNDEYAIGLKNGNYGVQIFDGSYNSLDSGVSAVTNTWTHVAYRATNSSQEYFVNGVLEASNGQNGIPRTAGFRPAAIGANIGNTPTIFADAKFDDIRIYNTNLSDQQINDIYNATEP